MTACSPDAEDGAISANAQHIILADVHEGDLDEGADIIDENGRIWRFLGRAGYVPDPEPDAEWPPQGPLDDADETGMPLEALAEAIRGVKLIDGFVYQMEPDYELATQIREAQMHAEREGPALPPMNTDSREVPIEDLIGQKLIFGSDNRAKQRANSSYPFSTQIWITNEGSNTAACSATLIGPRTAVSAAHCFHSNSGGASGWFSWRAWAPGVDNEDSNRYSYHPTQAYPSPNAFLINRCYGVTIPTSYFNGSSDKQYDYAVIEFVCGHTPGTKVGWLGTLVIPDALWYTPPLDLVTHYSYGYPTNFNEGCPGASTCNWPQIWGMGKGSSGRGYSSTLLEYESDFGSGQSGSGGYIIFEGKRYVVETHIGWKTTFLDDYNFGRRMTQVYFDSIKAWSPSWSPSGASWNDPHVP